MRAAVIILAALALLAGPVSAYARGKGSKQSGTEQPSDAKKKKSEEAEKAYKDTLGRMPDKKYDPWGSVR